MASKNPVGNLRPASSLVLTIFRKPTNYKFRIFFHFLFFRPHSLNCLYFWRAGLETCYFPDYLQGDYFVQSGIGLQSSSSTMRIQYKTVTIASEAVSPWGFCYKKLANDMYLTQRLVKIEIVSRYRLIYTLGR